MAVHPLDGLTRPGPEQRDGKSETGAGTREPYVRPTGLIYAVDEWPPPARLVMLGLQYAAMGAIYLVLVTIILDHAHVLEADRVNLMGIACIALAIGTALQALPRGPVGSGFLAPPVYSATYLAPSVFAAEIGGMKLVFGMMLFAGLTEVLVGLMLNRLRIIITPVLGGLAVFVIGLQLGIVGIGEMLDVAHEAVPSYHLHLAVTVLTLTVCVSLSLWGPGAAKLLCSLLGVLTGTVAGTFAGLLSPAALSAIAGAPWIAMPSPAVFDYGFDAGLLPAFLAAGIAASLRAVGVVTTCQRLNNAAWDRPDTTNIRKGVLADGLSNVIGSAIGATGMSVAPSLVGISGATGATSRAIGFASAAVLFVVGFSPKLVGVFLLVPPQVAGTILVFTASFMITGGMQVMLSRSPDTRATYVIGISTLLALSENVFPNYFRHISPAVHSLVSSPLSLGLTVAIALRLLFQVGTRKRAEIAWNDAAGSIASAAAFLRRQSQDWKLAANRIERPLSHLQQVIAYIIGCHVQHPSGVLRVMYNGMELRLDIVYRGTVANRLPDSASDTETLPIRDALENEESAVFVGLRNFLESLRADRKRIKQRGGGVTVSLYYAV